jgi:hypothetical protein
MQSYKHVCSFIESGWEFYFALWFSCVRVRAHLGVLFNPFDQARDLH